MKVPGCTETVTLVVLEVECVHVLCRNRNRYPRMNERKRRERTGVQRGCVKRAEMKRLSVIS